MTGLILPPPHDANELNTRIDICNVHSSRIWSVGYWLKANLAGNVMSGSFPHWVFPRKAIPREYPRARATGIDTAFPT